MSLGGSTKSDICVSWRLVNRSSRVTPTLKNSSLGYRWLIAIARDPDKSTELDHVSSSTKNKDFLRPTSARTSSSQTEFSHIRFGMAIPLLRGSPIDHASLHCTLVRRYFDLPLIVFPRYGCFLMNKPSSSI